ncbi:hypothetical protein [Mycobacteroides stephanolepidis]|nr:hypothetical protein [[Mycobacterium] stephanolepidis]
MPWCTDGDGHPHYLLRGDQSCWGPAHKVVFSLDDHAPASSVVPVPSDATGITVYAYRGYYELPKVKLNVFHDPGDDPCGIDHDFLLTPQEAVDLAFHLIGAAELIGGFK